jgi:hypothetical protein
MNHSTGGHYSSTGATQPDSDSERVTVIVRCLALRVLQIKESSMHVAVTRQMAALLFASLGLIPSNGG